MVDKGHENISRILPQSGFHLSEKSADNFQMECTILKALSTNALNWF